MMLPTRCVATAFLVLIPMASSAWAQSGLQWKFREGDTWQVRMTQELTSVVNEKTSQVTQEFELEWHIRSVNQEGVAEIEQSAKRIVLRDRENVLVDAVDSEPQPEDAPMAKRIRALLKVRFVTLTSPMGEILEVRIDDDVKAWLTEQLGMDEETARQMFAQEILSFPDHPIDVGATWTVATQSSAKGLGNVKNSSTYQYVGPDTLQGKKLERFKYSPAFQLDDNARELVRQEGAGTIWFDRERGRVVRSESNQEYELQRLNTQPQVRQKNTVKTIFEFLD